MKSTIRLFRALPIENKNKRNASKKILNETIKRGFIFSPEVVNSYTDIQLMDIIQEIEKYVGLTAEQMNSSFHKSWDKVENAPMIQLVMEQYVHYITTYGFKQLGIYNENSVYIPDEVLELPKSNKQMVLTVIKGYTESELKTKLLSLLQSGVALGEDTIEDCTDLFRYLKLTEAELSLIKNKEILIKLYDIFNIIPANAEEFLRYMVYKTTGKTLLIKNEMTHKVIKSSHVNVLIYFEKYISEYGLEKLSAIFYRYKLLFLSFKSNNNMNHIINRIRKLAKVHHKPFAGDYLNEVTSNIKQGKKISIDELNNKLKYANTFRKIRLLYALKYRMTDADSILYKIRNGRAFATKFSKINATNIESIYNIVYDSIVNDINENLKNKKIYLPDHIKYALPATEKQFTGNIPSGTHISIDSDMIIGVYWNNINNCSVDLDLSLNDESAKIGWDGAYRNESCDILFSGDITDASKGASELFYIKRANYGAYSLMLNHFNRYYEIDIPFKIVIGKEKHDRLSRNYMIDPNNVILTVDSKMTSKQKMLGLVYSTKTYKNFYFSETNIGQSISVGANTEYIHAARRYVETFYKNIVSLNDILKKSECIIVTDRKDADIDLSMDTLEKDTILNLFTKK